MYPKVHPSAVLKPVLRKFATDFNPQLMGAPESETQIIDASVEISFQALWIPRVLRLNRWVARTYKLCDLLSLLF